MKYKLEDCVASRLRRLSRIADNYMRKCLADHKITENQMTILFTLSELGRVEQGKIGEFLFLERSTVSRNIKLLQEQGLVKRSPEYRPEIELAGKGKELVKTLIPKWRKVMDELVGKLEKEGLEYIQGIEEKFD